MNPVLRFWLAALGVALTFAILTAVLFPYGALRIESRPERVQVWLLTVWTAGILAILFGASGLFAYRGALGFRDVAEAGSVRAALDRRRNAAHAAREGGFYGNFAWWLISTGGVLILIYFVGWSLTGLAWA